MQGKSYHQEQGKVGDSTERDRGWPVQIEHVGWKIRLEEYCAAAWLLGKAVKAEF